MWKFAGYSATDDQLQCVWTIYATPESTLNSHLVISERNRSASRFCAVKYAHLLTYLVVSFCIQLSEVWLHCVQLFSTNYDPGQYCCDRLCCCQSSPRRDVLSVMFLLFFLLGLKTRFLKKKIFRFLGFLTAFHILKMF